MESIDATFTAIPPNAEVKMLNRPHDVPTYFTDGIKGVMVQANVVKVCLFEQIMDPAQPGQLFARYVLNLAIPNEAFVAIADLLKHISDESVVAPPR